VAFDAAGRDLLTRVAAGKAGSTLYERALSDDLEALIYVRIPQFPSSRALGQAPIASIDEYTQRVPEDKSKWKIMPVDARPCPEEMRDSEAPVEEPLPSLLAVSAYGGLAGMAAIGGVWLRLRRRKRVAQQ